MGNMRVQSGDLSRLFDRIADFNSEYKATNDGPSYYVRNKRVINFPGKIRK